MISGINTDFQRDEFAEGTAASRRDEPFSQWTTPAWQLGWTIEKRRQAVNVVGVRDYCEIDDIVQALGLLCLRLRDRGPIAVDLAQAIALRALDGQDFRLDPPTAIRTADMQVAS